MNQERIMKRKMYAAIIISIVTVIALCVFIALYFDERTKTQLAYRTQYNESLTDAHEELSIYLEKGKDYALHYDLVIGDLGAARSFAFLINDVTDQQKNTMNELYYCFVKYPEQMREKLEESAQAIGDMSENLDKGYDEAQAIVDSINKKGS